MMRKSSDDCLKSKALKFILVCLLCLIIVTSLVLLVQYLSGG